MSEISGGKRKKLYGWGKFPAVDGVCYRPEKLSEQDILLERAAGEKLSCIARGSGLSYGDAAYNEGDKGLTIEQSRLDNFIAMDNVSGQITVQAGVLLQEIMAVSVPRGWMVPVMPGVSRVTIGGAVACNIHGKNHVQAGNIGNYIVGLRLRLGGGDVRELMASSRKKSDKSLLSATIGGMGMTGVIEQVTLQLVPATSASFRVDVVTTQSIYEMIEQFIKTRDSHSYRVGWLDHFVPDRGVFEAAEIAVADGVSDDVGNKAVDKAAVKVKDYHPDVKRFSIPSLIPFRVVNNISMRLYNILRFRRNNRHRGSKLVGMDAFLHPLETLGNWHHLYGRKGLIQYQCLIPCDKTNSEEIIERIETCLNHFRNQGLYAYLVVLKEHKDDNSGMLSFASEGYSLALDFPYSEQLAMVCEELNQMVNEWGGRVYLAKDALLTAESFNKMYGSVLPEWQKILSQVNPKQQLTSAMAKRLQFYPVREESEQGEQLVGEGGSDES